MGLLIADRKRLALVPWHSSSGYERHHQAQALANQYPSMRDADKPLESYDMAEFWNDKLEMASVVVGWCAAGTLCSGAQTLQTLSMFSGAAGACQSIL